MMTIIAKLRPPQPAKWVLYPIAARPVRCKNYPTYMRLSPLGLACAALACLGLLLAAPQLRAGQSGSVVGWGYQVTPPTDAGARLVAISGGGNHTLALRADGTVSAWGENYLGQCAVPSGLSNVLAVAAGGDHSLALRQDGTVAAWGENSGGQTDVPTNLAGVVAIAAGGSHSLALKSDGTVVAWGQLEIGSTWP
jgi:alpha-tubulin suppressor-like RCC1 family protein